MPLPPPACRDSRWHDFLQRVRESMDSRNFAAWIERLEPSEVSDRRVVADAPSPFAKTLIERRFLPVLRAAARSSLGAHADVSILCRPPEADTAPPAVAAVEGPPSEPRIDDLPAPRNPRPRFELSLNPAYTFENFVVGPSNELSHAASLRVVSAPALAYNPLYIHGASGLGKTHLLQATCRSLMERDPDLRVLYLSCEEFTNRYIRALEQGSLPAFRDRMRHLDCLAVDDVQFLSTKRRLQEEFFHTFNALYDARKQIILSSDSKPHVMADFEERLTTRFGWGLLTSIDPPTPETRRRIAERKARAHDRSLTEEVARYVAEVAPRNVRELEGAVIKLLATADLWEREIDIDLAREALEDLASTHHRPVSMAEITSEVAARFGVKPAALASPGRARAISLPRQFAMHLMKTLLPVSLKEIGSSFGGRDHSTVLNAIRRIDSLLDRDPEMRRLHERLLSDLKSRSRS
jgi:chromosomal replication initiator protein